MIKYLLTIASILTSITTQAQSIVINEIMAANVDVYQDPSTNFGSWVELYNPTSKAMTLGGLYVSDDPANLKKHQLVSNYGTLPGHGYAILNFDHYEQWTSYAFRQIDDKLNVDGGTIIISDGTTILAQETYPEAISRVSYARTTDGGSEWGLTSSPTPGKTNTTSNFATTQLPAPEVTPEAQVFTSKVTIKVTIPEGATLRYTTDGSTPTLTNGNTSTTGNLATSVTKCLRFRLFQDGKLASPVVTRSYINSTNHPFPIISVVTNKSNIMDGSTKAIFSYSSYGRKGNGQTNAYNGNMDWDRPVNFEYFTTDGKCVLSQECDFSACGGWSRGWEPHSFKLKANKAYEGQSYLPYQFFGMVDANPSTANGKDFLKHKTLQIRNGGNDTGCRIKDAAIQDIIASSGLYVEHQSWQPVIVYINGTQYAVLNMREPNNKHYGYANYGISTDQMDQFEICPDSGYVQKTGTKESFNRWYDLSKTVASETSYQEICKLVDIDEYCNYMAVCLYAGSWDWPQNNVKGFRDQEDGKFRFVLFDLDAALGSTTPMSVFFGKRNYTFDTLHGYDYTLGKSIEGTHLNKELEFVTIFQNMLNNATFRKKFIDTYCLVAGSVFNPQRVATITNKMSSYLSTGGFVSPSSTANEIINGFTAARQTAIINELKSNTYTRLSSTTPQTVSLSSNINDAQILVNGIEVPTGKFSGQLFYPITLNAQAPAGYKFLGWLSSQTTGKAIFSNGSTWKYYDSGSLDNTDWKSSTYSDASWKSGSTPIGYGKSQPTTTTANLLTYYLRKTINISDYNSSDIFTLNYTIDDGMVVYVNGKEAGRYNMPSGTITSSTAASTYANGNPDTGSMTLDASLFHNGTNVIAVEIHNNQTASSDIVWNSELLRTTAGAVSYVSTDTQYQLPSGGTQTLVASWQKISDEAATDSCAAPIKINEVSAANSTFISELQKKDDWIELYNTTDTDINLSGLYLSDDLSNPQKYQIQPSTELNENSIIPAHGHAIIWCDKRQASTSDVILGNTNYFHASFKLDNADGSAIILSSSDEFIQNNATFYSAHPNMKKAFTDTLYYSTMRYDQTIGRYPDGSNTYYLMNHPTISYTNSIQPSDLCIGHDTSHSSSTDAIININNDQASQQSQNYYPQRYYTPSGIFVGTDRSRLPRGIYKRK